MTPFGLDKETYSQIDLKAAGLHNYATDASTGIHCFSYGPDPQHVKTWAEGESFPEDLAEHIASGGIITAWNAAFEWSLWNLCAVRKYGWKPLPIEQIRCSMVRAYAMALPGALEDAAPALGVDQRKDAEGHRIMLQLAKPKKDGSMWRRDAESLDKFVRLYEYNRQDVRTELACLGRLMDLSQSENELWNLDHRINNRGVMCDLESIDKAIAIVEAEQKRLNGEMLRATGGVVGTCNEVQMLGKWIKAQGVEMNGLAKADVLNALAADDRSDAYEVITDENDRALEVIPPREELPPQIRAALLLRQEAAKSSTAKLVAMREKASTDGRIRNLHQFHAASTGRWAGRGVQFQNLFRGRPGMAPTDIEAMFSMLDDKAMLDMFYGPSMDAVADCVRGMIVAGPGNELVACDFSQVEARVLPWLAGQESVLEVFRTHGLIYEHAASAIYHVPMEEVTKAQRQIGKVSVLACVAEDTLVLTSNGYKAIVEVTIDDLLWDGAEWTKHDGVVFKGYKKVLNVDGLEVTPDHLIKTQQTWQPAQVLAFDASILYRALETGSESLPFSGSNASYTVPAQYQWSGANALVEPNRISSPITISEEESLRGAISALKRKRINGGKISGIMRMLFRTTLIADAFLIGFHPASIDAITLKTAGFITTEAEASTYLRRGEIVDGRFYRTWSHLKVGISQLWSWIGSMWTKATNLEIYGSLRDRKISEIKDKWGRCKNESLTLKPVYDILNVGSRNCFLVKTISGHMLVHNCGYGGGVGAFQAMARAYNVHISDKEADEIKKAWRAANQKIVQYWYDLENAVVSAMQSNGVVSAGAAGRQVKFRKSGSFLWALLPGGRALCYPYPELRMVMTPWGEEKEQLTFMTVVDMTQKKKAKVLDDPNAKGRWQRVSTYGGSLAENMTQAVARDLLAEAMIAIEAEGIEIVFHVHDEAVAEVKQFRASYALERMEKIMSTAPPWAKGLPLAAEGYRARRYRKG